MNLNQFEYLLAIHQYGSITKAAQHLFVSAPAISNAIKSLEDEMGYPILIRQQNGVSFTKEGEETILALQIIQEQLLYLKQLGRKNNNLSGEFILGGTSHFNSAILLKLILKMQEQYPDLKLHLKSGDSDAIISDVGQGLVDIGLVLICQLDAPILFREINRNQLIFQKLFSDELRFVVRKEHPLLQKSTVSLSNIFQYPYICYVETVRNYVPDFFEALLSQMDSQQKHYKSSDSLNMIRINDRESLYDMLLYTNGMTLMPYSNRRFLETRQPDLRFLNISDTRLQCKVGLIRREKFLSKMETMLWEHILTTIQTLI